MSFEVDTMTPAQIGFCVLMKLDLERIRGYAVFSVYTCIYVKPGPLQSRRTD